MASKNRTGLALIVLIGAALGWETFTLTNSVPGDTISETVQWVFFNYPFVTLLVGVLLGHFVWPIGKPKVEFQHRPSDSEEIDKTP